MFKVIELIKNLNGQKTLDLIIAVVIVAIFDIFSPILTYLTIKIFNLKFKGKEIKENPFYVSLKGFYRITGVYLVFLFLKNDFGFTKEMVNIVTKIYKIIVVLFISNSLARGVTKKSKIISRVKERSANELNDGSIKLIIRIIRTLIYIVALFIIFKEMGYDLSGLVTGLGLGSVVITLAAQDTLKNILGGIIVFMDKPFKPGDFIKIKEYQGVIEDMTFRSTRLRTLDNSVIQIPNSLIANESIENITKIKNRRYKLNLELVLDTNLTEIQILKKSIFEYLMQNENVLKETINIHFDKITSNGYNVLVMCYLNVSEYIDYLDITEGINENIIRIINNEKINLAYDTKTIGIKK